MKLQPLLMAAALALAACGGGPRPGPTARPVEALPEGEGIYRLRYNPPPCLADQPELHAEVRIPSGWERVSLESGAEDVDLVAALLTRFGRDPAAAVPVSGNLTARVRTWAGQHTSRILVVQVVDPPVAPTETPAAPEESVDDPPAEAPAPAG